jgi:hypothetical protein
MSGVVGMMFELSLMKSNVDRLLAAGSKSGFPGCRTVLTVHAGADG